MFDNGCDDTFAFTADNLSGNIIDLGILTLDDYENRTDGKVFKNEVMRALYKALTGKDNATLDDVNKLAEYTAADIRAKNSNRDLILTLDGKQWTVTYFGKTNESKPQPYITLWLANSEEKVQWNKWFANNSCALFPYPANMYSSSYIRAVGLNSGSGYIASNTDTVLTSIDEETKLSHKYAKFTMPKDKVKGSITSYIIQPSKVAYQGTEDNFLSGNTGYTLPNEAYGTPGSGGNYYIGSADMNVLPTRTGYSDWKDDYIWLPSLTETGESNAMPGLWSLSVAQRSTNGGNYSWLRSSHALYTNGTYVVDAQGDSKSSGIVSDNGVVRPAFHLNLAAADSSSVKSLSDPADFEVTYDGSSHDITDAGWYNNNKDIYSDTSKMTVTYSEKSPTNVKDGGYEISFTIISDELQWSNAQNLNDKTRTCKMTIKAAEPNITPIIGAYTLYPGDGLGKFPSLSLPTGAPSGTISWDSGQTASTTKAYNWTFKSTDKN
ncbi:MAG: hypothetical protein K2I79_04075, partial [Clostridia bacterium]|nr:hypothetical protein [Clostridia bacterium]